MSVATIRAAADYWRIPTAELLGRNRRPPFVRARAAVAYVMRHRDGASYPVIGRRLGGRDHSTIIHAVQCADNWLQRDEHFAEFVRAQMALPKYSQRAAVLESPFEAPAAPIVLVVAPPKPALGFVASPRPKPPILPKWEDEFKADEPDESYLHFTQHMRIGSLYFIEALRREHPERCRA